MKCKRSNIFTTALNSARTALNTASGVFHELTLPDGTDKTFRFRLSEYGEFPVEDVKGQAIIQVVDREAAETMALNFGSLRGQFATFFRGIPMFEGHADDAAWLAKNPGHKASAVARIKSIEPEDDGVYVTAALNSDGVDLLGGDAPKYTGQSPLWRLDQIPGRPGFFRPILLWSVALTNNPNIMTNTIALNSLQGVTAPDLSPTADPGENETNENEDMKLTADALAALGFAQDATPSSDEISAAIVKMLAAKATAEADKATAVGETTAANSRAGLMETELKLVRGSAIDALIGPAIEDGRITAADKDKWTTALNTSFASESAKIAALMPTINVANKLPGLTRQQGMLAANDTEALNTAVREIAKTNGLDLAKGADYDRAFTLLRAAKPELFETTAK